MAKCNHCSAPLPANSTRCVYCRVRNDVDLHSRYDVNEVENHHHRICPECETELKTIEVNLNNSNLNNNDFNSNESVEIEQCASCFGLFFDQGELEQLMQQSVSGFMQINHQLMSNINKDRYKKNSNVRYRKCPECQTFMQRKNYGHRSGVIVDRCFKHGIWMDSSEVVHLLEWKKAGGSILNEEVITQKQADDKAKSDKKRYTQAFSKSKSTDYFSSNSSPSYKQSEQLVDSVADFLFKLF